MLPKIENTCGRAGGYCSQIVWADGKVYPGRPAGPAHHPATADLAGSLGNGAQQLLHHQGRRGLGAGDRVPDDRTYSYSNGTVPITELTMPYGGALQLTQPLTGVHEGLHRLAVALWLIILIGVGFAVLLGLGGGAGRPASPRRA